MPISYINTGTPVELHDPFECDERVAKALMTVSAFVALADGRVEAIERDEAISYIERHRLARRISYERYVELFEECVRRIEDRDVATLISDALQNIGVLSLISDVVPIAERVAAADRRIVPSELQAIGLIRLVATNLRTPEVVRSYDG
jgi:tellurite resistance protein TerB